MATIDVPTFEQIVTILSQLATNYTNIFDDYYNLFYNPTPMDVTVQLYDDTGNLSTITIPNRAKDRTYILNGNGDPNNNVSAPKGSIYQDLNNGEVYVKQFANTDNTGWSKLMTFESFSDFLIQGSGNPEGSVSAPKGVVFVDKSAANLYIKSTSTGNTGWTMISADSSNLANIDLSNLSTTGEDHFANPSLSNLNLAGTALINSKENSTNKVTTISASSTDVQYPSAKAVYDLVGDGTGNLANKSLSNLDTTGESHFLGMTQVRDCILKAPNGLPSVSGNIISLPASTILLCANGINTDNSLKNEKVTISNDLSVSVSWTNSDSGVVFYNHNTEGLIYYASGAYFNQEDTPSGLTNMIWYNPSTNEYKISSDSGSNWSTIKAAEIARFSTNSTGNITEFSPFHPIVVATQDDLLGIGNTTGYLGQTVFTLDPLFEEGLHLLDGALLQGNGVYKPFIDYYIAPLYNLYPGRFISEADWQQSVTDHGVCGYYVYDTVNNTVRLPKVTGFVEGTIDSTALGQLTEAGLPNITGQIGTALGSPSTGQAGSLYKISDRGSYVQGSASQTGLHDDFMGFDASRSSALYKNNFNKVQPQSISGYMYIVLANRVDNVVSVNQSGVITEINGKADVDLSNVNNTGRARAAGWALPSETYVSLTLGASGSTYTAPANGWVQLTVTSDSSSATSLAYIAVIYDNQDGICMKSFVPPNLSNAIDIYVPVSKGETFLVGYAAIETFGTHETDRFEFIYAVGSESEAS